MKNPQTIYLKDYKAPAFVIDQVDLTLDIFDTHTDVSSILKIRKNGSSSELELMGERMELLEIKRDGKVLDNSQYTLSSEGLVVHGVTGDTKLEIKNRIKPQENTALEGFYQSGDIFCSQCESEGFRKITYFIDRPDMMAKYRTTLSADKGRFPLLLSNGNRVAHGDLPGGRHFVTWDDPFKKPSYLFAAVAGDLELARDTFKTQSGRTVALEVYVDKGQGKKTKHALESLKNAMRWDEETFGLEYDLDIYMIVAVESFNFGAMENKGLNIFNSAYVLADPATATDSDYQGVEGVVGHEYFHNWTGNRVTCRDWFQLTLKEGLTVFRDQEFSSDMLSRAVKRIEDVKRLREHQFPEDAGPTAHPIRPSSYIEINNFYTPTVYEKGAEVIRMIHTLIGDKNFKAGMKEYFKRHDGQAVTTEDFVAAMEAASGKDLTQFKNWYSRPGTPTLKVTSEYNQKDGLYTLNVRQVYPTVLHEKLENNVLHIPFKVALFDEKGQIVGEEKIFELKKLEETLTFTNVKSRPTPSLNRTFAAPVIVEYSYSLEDLLHLVAHDNDAVSRYEALQQVYMLQLAEWVKTLKEGGKLSATLALSFSKGLRNILKDPSLDSAFKAYLFEVPSEAQLNQELPHAWIEEVHEARKHMVKLIGAELASDWLEAYNNSKSSNEDFSAKAMGHRALKNRALSMLVKGGHPEAMTILEKHFYQATCMTDESTGLSLYAQVTGAERARALEHFYKKWKHESLVMLRWFGVQAVFAPAGETAQVMQKLETDPVFRPQVPNDIRAVYQGFARSNLLGFHAKDGSGYELLVDRIIKVDAFNPQVAARMAGAFSLMSKLDEGRKKHMQDGLKKLVGSNPSKDVFEMASRFLGQ